MKITPFSIQFILIIHYSSRWCYHMWYDYIDWTEESLTTSLL